MLLKILSFIFKHIELVNFLFLILFIATVILYKKKEAIIKKNSNKCKFLEQNILLTK